MLQQENRALKQHISTTKSPARGSGSKGKAGGRSRSQIIESEQDVPSSEVKKMLRDVRFLIDQVQTRNESAQGNHNFYKKISQDTSIFSIPTSTGGVHTSSALSQTQKITFKNRSSMSPNAVKQKGTKGKHQQIQLHIGRQPSTIKSLVESEGTD